MLDDALSKYESEVDKIVAALGIEKKNYTKILKQEILVKFLVPLYLNREELEQKAKKMLSDKIKRDLKIYVGGKMGERQG
ncbi:MAG: hypothetical protein NWF09_07630 [Candidatus Bathyarchaeota archaeon]|nr:hypothetical protein [Candidatus Bathyarchaeota archaeon]